MTHPDVVPGSLRFRPLSPAPASNPARLFIDDDGGAPLRCCLRDSLPGERLALVAVTPEGPQGAYRETGPVFLHAEGCDGPAGSGYPEQWRARAQVFRAYDHSGAITGGTVVPAGSGQEDAAAQLLADPSVAFVQTRNVVHGCYMLTIERTR